MKLIDLYGAAEAEDVLWQLLGERTPEVNISHKKMPSLDEHHAFIASKPHPHWYLIDTGASDYVGAIYLTQQREIGIGILRRFWGFGYGKMATQMLMDRHPGKFLANINPSNYKSSAMFRDLGFSHIQNTYAGPTGNPEAMAK